MALEYSAQRFGRAKVGTTTMIFKADQRTTIPTDCHISNTAGHLRSFVDGPGVEYSKSSHVRPIGWPVVVRQQLVAATDRQHGHIVFNGGPQADTLYLMQILGDRGLLFILSTTNEQHIVLIWRQRVTDASTDYSQ